MPDLDADLDAIVRGCCAEPVSLVVLAALARAALADVRSAAARLRPPGEPAPRTPPRGASSCIVHPHQGAECTFRPRGARERYDEAAHSLTVIVVQAEAGRRYPARADEVRAVIEAVARDALSAARCGR